MEIQNRLTQLSIAMQAADVDLVAIGPTASMRYLLDYAPQEDERLCLLLVSKGSAAVVIPSLNADEMAAHTAIQLFRWNDAEGPRQAVLQALKEASPINKLAVDGAMRADFLLNLLELLEPQETITVEALLKPIRACKSQAEIEAIAQAAAQADRAMQAAIDACQVGVTEMDVAWSAETAFRLDGAQQVSFTLVASGPNGAYPHHHSGQRQLQEGDAIIIDIGASLNGYSSDITRMVFLGDPSPEFLQAYAAVLEANQQGRAAVKPGVTAHQVDRAARSVLEEAGYGQYYIHRTGHGLGLEVHEPPWIMAGNLQILEPGMVFSIEPGVYIEGQFGIRIEDIVAVTADGCRTFTGSSHQLVIKRV